jgi:hypothetical protein
MICKGRLREDAMRTIFALFVPILCVLYLADKYEFGGHYTDALLAQSRAVGQQYRQELKDWWRHH